MHDNPYHSPAFTKVDTVVGLSRKVYAVASIVVGTLWLFVLAGVAWYGQLSITGGEVTLNFPSQTFSNTPLGDPTISSNFLYTTTTGAVVLIGGAIALSLAIVNGLIAFLRR